MNQPRYTSLRDYLGALRRQRWIVLLIAAAFAVAALGYSLSQTPTYLATTSLAYSDITEELRVLGTASLPVQGPAERAAANARTIETLTTARAVAKALESEITADELQSAVTTRVSTDTGFVVIEARWDGASEAAEIANAYGLEAVETARRDQRARLQAVIRGFQAQLPEEEKKPADPLVPVTPPTASEEFAQQQVNQLRAIKRFADPARVTARAEIPEDAESPKPIRNTVLGLLVGLTFGLLAAFARDSLDRKIHTPGQAYEALGFPILGRVGEGAMGKTGLVTGPGGQAAIGGSELESFRMLRTNLGMLAAQGNGLSTILVTSGLPEEGKSTVAVSLATAAAAAGQRVLLVDCDLRRPVLATRLGLEGAPGLTDFLAGDATPAEIVQIRSLGGTPAAPAPGSSNGASPEARGPVAPEEPEDAELSTSFAVIPAGNLTPNPAELLASDRCRKFIDQVGRVYDLVIIDSSPLLASVDPLELLPHVDAALLCVRADRSTIEEVGAVRNALGMLPDRPTGIVLTGVKSGGGGYGDYLTYYGYEPVA